LHAKLAVQPRVEELKPGLIQAAGEMESFDSRESWHNHAEVVFHMMDLNKSKSLDKHELSTILGPTADALIAKLMTGEGSEVTVKGWMNHLHKLEDKEGTAGVDAFLHFADIQLAKHQHETAGNTLSETGTENRQKQKDDAKQELLSGLEKHLLTRPERDHLQARGKIKDADEHEAQLHDLAAAKSELEASLQLRPDVMQSRQGAAANQELAPLPEPHGFDWRNAAEIVFQEMDLDGNGTVDHAEIVAVFGDEADALLHQLQVSEGDGRVSATEFVAQVERIKSDFGMQHATTFLEYATAKTTVYNATHNSKKIGRAAQMRLREAAQSEVTKATKAALAQKLALQPEKGRLQSRGLLKSKHEMTVAKMNQSAAASNLETALQLRPERAALEAKGRIKDIDTHEAQKAEKQRAAVQLEGLLAKQPTKVNLHTAGKLKLQFDPRGDPALVKAIFQRHTAPTGLDYLAMDQAPFRAALVEVSQAFEVPLNVDAIIKDAQGELEINPDLEGFEEVLDVVEALIDVYLA